MRRFGLFLLPSKSMRTTSASCIQHTAGNQSEAYISTFIKWPSTNLPDNRSRIGTSIEIPSALNETNLSTAAIQSDSKLQKTSKATRFAFATFRDANTWKDASTGTSANTAGGSHPAKDCTINKLSSGPPSFIRRRAWLAGPFDHISDTFPYVLVDKSELVEWWSRVSVLEGTWWQQNEGSSGNTCKRWGPWWNALSKIPISGAARAPTTS